MELVRLGAAECRQQEDAVYQDSEYITVDVLFRNFGRGTERTSDYRLEFKWDDVEKLITEFAAMKTPQAIRLLQSKSLGIAAGRAGWTPKNQE